MTKIPPSVRLRDGGFWIPDGKRDQITSWEGERFLAPQSWVQSAASALMTRGNHSHSQNSDPESAPIANDSDMQADLVEFRAEHERMRSGLRESADECLSELIDEGSTEHFPLSESAELHDAMKRQEAVLDILSCLNIPVIDAEFADRYTNYISQSIYACAVLHAVQGIHSWGWLG